MKWKEVSDSVNELFYYEIAETDKLAIRVYGGECNDPSGNTELIFPFNNKQHFDGRLFKEVDLGGAATLESGVLSLTTDFSDLEYLESVDRRVILIVGGVAGCTIDAADIVTRRLKDRFDLEIIIIAYQVSGGEFQAIEKFADEIGAINVLSSDTYTQLLDQLSSSIIEESSNIVSSSSDRPYMSVLNPGADNASFEKNIYHTSYVFRDGAIHEVHNPARITEIDMKNKYGRVRRNEYLIKIKSSNITYYNVEEIYHSSSYVDNRKKIQPDPPSIINIEDLKLFGEEIHNINYAICLYISDKVCSAIEHEIIFFDSENHTMLIAGYFDEKFLVFYERFFVSEGLVRELLDQKKSISYVIAIVSEMVNKYGYNTVLAYNQYTGFKKLTMLEEAISHIGFGLLKEVFYDDHFRDDDLFSDPVKSGLASYRNKSRDQVLMDMNIYVAKNIAIACSLKLLGITGDLYSHNASGYHDAKVAAIIDRCP
ncbi:MAG: hypothetical protein Tsb002_01070 [Wenzhouxiangellaceae bacterium]